MGSTEFGHLEKISSELYGGDITTNGNYNMNEAEIEVTGAGLKDFFSEFRGEA